MSLRRPLGSQGRHEPSKWDRGDVNVYGRSTGVQSPAQRGEVTESGLIPPEIDWSDLRAYVCNSCKDHCINWIEADCTRANECRTCHRVRRALLSPTTASEGKREAARLVASDASGESAPERPEGATASTGRKRTPSHGGPTRKPERTPRPRRGRGERERGEVL